jgi:thiol:disulfide interchange protein
MACLVFAMGLSLLGVFEIPLPGFIGAAASQSEREGLFGVFLSGAVTTLLATPCTGPFLSPVIVWSLGQTTGVTYLVWTIIGIGMASPYLALGVFPQALKLLPKPGAWMETFKQVAGFVMLGTVLFLLSSVRDRDTLISELFLLLGIGFGLWLVGTQINILTSPAKAWVLRGLAVVLGIAVAAVPSLLFAPKLLPWEPFSETRMEQLVKEGKPILIDFTADWCLNCKANERIAIETRATLAKVKEYGIKPLLADFTDGSAEIDKWLTRFGARGIPLTVIIPAGAKTPVVLDGIFTQATLLDGIEKAMKRESPSAASAN